MSSNKQYFRSTSYGDIDDEGDNRQRVTRWWVVEKYDGEEHRIQETSLEFTVTMNSDTPWTVDPVKDNVDLEISKELFLEEYIEFTLEVTNHFAR